MKSVFVLILASFSLDTGEEEKFAQNLMIPVTFFKTQIRNEKTFIQ